MSDHVSFMREAVRLAQDNHANGAHTFGTVLTRNGQRVATGVNEVAQTCDPISHAEIQAMHAAYAALGLALQPTPLPMVRIDTEVTAAQVYGDAPASAHTTAG